MTERELIERIQDSLKQMKADLVELQKINTDAGRLEAANDLMGLRGEVLVWHCNATKILHRNFPSFASQIQTRGPGGGR